MAASTHPEIRKAAKEKPARKGAYALRKADL
jgi:hypothetical protein